MELRRNAGCNALTAAAAHTGHHARSVAVAGGVLAEQHGRHAVAGDVAAVAQTDVVVVVVVIVVIVCDANAAAVSAV